MNKLRSYYLLTKPGMVYGNMITTSAGFLLASQGNINWGLLGATLAGISLIIASGCVFNNYIDRNIDSKMERTKDRALAKKAIPGRNAMLFATILAIAGVGILATYTNLLTIFLAFVGFIFYIILYGIAKRYSPYGAHVGTISGAMPILIGYCSVTNQFDIGATILLVLLVIWQIPHFFSISIYRLQDYTAAAIPVLPIKKGIQTTKEQMLIYIIAFALLTPLLTAYGFTGYIYLTATTVANMIWLLFALRGFRTENSRPWARKMFFISLIVIMTFCFSLIINSIFSI